MKSKAWEGIERRSRRTQNAMMEIKAILSTRLSRKVYRGDSMTRHLSKTVVGKCTFAAARIKPSKIRKTWPVISANCTMASLLKALYTEFVVTWCSNDFLRANRDNQQSVFSLKKADSFVAAGLATLDSPPSSITSSKNTMESPRSARSGWRANKSPTPTLILNHHCLNLPLCHDSFA